MTTPQSERVLRARLAAHSKWATTPDRSAATASARQAFRDRFLGQVPAEITDPIERAKAAESLRKAHYTRLALRSARSRRLGKELLADAAQAEVELSGMDGGDAA